jgi:hypothetical protein
LIVSVRGEKLLNQEALERGFEAWTSKTDLDAKIAKMKDG